MLAQKSMTLWKTFCFKYLWEFPVGVHSQSGAIWISLMLTSYYIVITFATKMTKQSSQKLMLLFFAHIMKCGLPGISQIYLRNQGSFLGFLFSLIKNVTHEVGG